MCAEDFATGSPRPVVVRICLEAGLLADGGPVSASIKPGTGIRCAFPCALVKASTVALQQHHRSQLRGQPRLGPRSLLSFDACRRTSKAQGYAGYGGGSMSASNMQDAVVARELAPAGQRNGPRALYGRCATEREQAPSPQQPDRHAPCTLTTQPHPCSPVRLVTGALHRVKRETGESCALLQGHVSPVLPPQR